MVNDKLFTIVPLMASAMYGSETSFDLVSTRPPCIMRCIEGCMFKLDLPLHDVIIDAVPFWTEGEKRCFEASEETLI